MRKLLVVLSIILSFVITLSGCKGNTDKSVDNNSKKIPTENYLLANTVEPRKITGYNTFEYVKVFIDNIAVRITFQLPYDMYCKLDVKDWYFWIESHLYVFEKQTYTKDDRYHFPIDLTRAEPDYAEKKLEELKSGKENFGAEYELFDDGTILYDPVISPGNYNCEKYFEEGFVLKIQSLLSEFDKELAHTIASTAKIELVDDENPSLKQITGEEAVYGVASEKYNGYGFSCKDWRKGEEYQIEFTIPEGIKYEWYDYYNPDTAPDVCGIVFSDGTGYNETADYWMFKVKIDFLNSENKDRFNTKKSTSHGNGIYSYEPISEDENSSDHSRIYFKTIKKKYVAYIEQHISEEPKSEFDELEQRVLFDIFNSLSVKK